MQELNQWFLKFADPLLNPLLSLPMDLVLCILAVGTAVLILLIRKMTTDQDLLRRCRSDRVRLRSRLKEARQAKNDHDVSRFKTVLSTIGFRAMKQEGLPLLVSLLPITLIASWAFARLGYHAPASGEWVVVEFTVPVTETGKLIHLVPQDGLETDDGWIQEVEKKNNSPMTAGVASWAVRASAGTSSYPLIIRLGEKTFRHEFSAGPGSYSTPFRSWQDGEHSLIQKLSAYRPLGHVPGIDDFLFPAWLVGYLILVVPAVPILKKWMRVF
ncbi:MAG: hypothetical protein QF437_10195 [Planctomycetota bacterium]|jgi:uncharacterized membrane protein (DUF106 family)|nr:hypothetical protein [Planctomycetota bacterium]MDP7130849.1 hypothetical protein [Planctomycetota bacterium]MDP7248694.1 hypothetical protein [Planctomycetota bacterium]